MIPSYSILQCGTNDGGQAYLNCIAYVSGFNDILFIIVPLFLALMPIVAAVKLAGFAGTDG